METTILIPSYNCGKFLLESIGSVLRQSYTDYEILIVDDGSTDNTEQVIESLNCGKIRYFKNETNLGIVHSLNKGLALANGEFIARMDADDVMIGERLADQISFLKTNPTFGMVGGAYQIVDVEGRHLKIVNAHRDSRYLRLGLMFRNHIHHATVTMRKSIVSKLLYDPEFQYCEDHDLWIRICEQFEITNLPGCYLTYRWHAENSSSRYQQILRQNLTSLLSRELDKMEVEHSPAELMVHAAACIGYGSSILHLNDNLNILNGLYDKIFSSRKIIKQYDPDWLAWFRRDILARYCFIEPQTSTVL